VYFGAYELFKRQLTRLSALPAPANNFLAGGCSATMMWCVAFPTDVVKNRLQAQNESAKRYRGTLDCVRQIMAADGWRGFYRGFTPCLLRSFPANGAAFLSLEFVSEHFPS